jgi:hypothetical protein
LCAHGVVQRDRLEDVQELPLVLVDALDLHVEQRIRIEAQAQPIGNQPRQRHLVLAAHRGETLPERGVVGQRGECFEPGRVVLNLRSDGVDDKLRQCRIRLVEPTAERDPVGLVTIRSG